MWNRTRYMLSASESPGCSKSGADLNPGVTLPVFPVVPAGSSKTLLSCALALGHCRS